MLSHTLYRPRRTDRQLLGCAVWLSSYYVLRTRQGPFHQGGSGTSMEIPRLVPLARDDRQGKAPRPQGFTRSLPSCCAAASRHSDDVPCPGPYPGIPATRPNCHPDGARRAIGGISNSEPLPLEMVKPCPGADDTKESLSFGRQPSPFKGRNQSWFHPLRTPSQPGAAAPGPHGGQRAVVTPFAYHLPAAMHRPPAARCCHPIVFVLLFENKAGVCFR